MRKRQDFYPGQICLFDRYNFTGLKGADSICMVSVMAPYKKRLFNRFSQWMVFSPATQEVLVVPESFLCPAPTVEQIKNLENVIIIRNPINLPEFNINDVHTLRKAIGVLEEHKTFYDKAATVAINDVNDIIKGLNKILLKFKFYSRMNTKNLPMNLGRISSTPYEDNGNNKEYDDENYEDDV